MTAKDKILPFLKLHISILWHLILWYIQALFFTSWLGWLIALIAGITTGVSKELWDKAHGRKFDLWDLGADIVATILGIWTVIKFG